MDWAWTTSGLAVGFIVGMTGVGGGSVMTPMPILLFGVSPATAVGTDLLYASLTKVGGACVRSFKSTINWKIVCWLSAGSIPATLATIAWLHSIGADSKQFSALVSVTLGGVLILTAAALISKGRIRRWAPHCTYLFTGLRKQFWATRGRRCARRNGNDIVRRRRSAWHRGAVLSLPRLPHGQHCRYRYRSCDSAHSRRGSRTFNDGKRGFHTLLGSVLLGSLPGVYLGSQLSGKIPERALQAGLAAVLATVGCKLVM
jgi:uncharacterized membrane protein YfcA